MFRDRFVNHRKPRTAALSAAVGVVAIVLALGGCAQESEGSAQMAETLTAGSSDALSGAEESSVTESADGSAAETTESTETTETTETSSTTSAPPDASSDTEPVISDEPSDADRPAGGDSPGADPSCLVGDWTITEDEMQSYYDNIGVPAEFTLTGDTGLTFTADSFEYTPDFTLKMNIQGTDAEATLRGSVAGSYTTDGSILTTSNQTNDISMKIQVGGQTIDGAGQFDSLLDAFSLNKAPYKCGDPGPVLMFETSGSQRTPVQLVPHG